MKILFTFENSLPSTEADAEVFVTTARYLAPLATEAWLHVPMRDPGDAGACRDLAGMPAVRARAPIGPAALRHFCCGITLPFRTEFRRADLVYTRNLWIAWMSLLFGQRVVFDHYRPWPDQIPPLQLWLHRLFCNRRLLVNICHSEYTRGKYLKIGVPADKLRCIHNGYEPRRLEEQLSADAAKRKLGLAPNRKTVVYTGRVNHKKGLDLVIQAARSLPEVQFVLVGSYGDGPIEALAKDMSNMTVVPFQPAEKLSDYIFAADLLLIPPSWAPLAKYGSTVLPLKLFLYLAAGRPILAGETPDVMEVLRHGDNAILCKPDDVAALVDGISTVFGDQALAARIAAKALEGSRELTWSARVRKIHELIADRLRSAAAAPGVWSPVQAQTWREQSRRWFVHLLRERSFILPPALPAPSQQD
ncbi:MAG TPA: glycosyltransferase [Alphaproteobacteria bacterium]|nr:glycosyltransferase [Alphaproteobacteria bacterium]